MLVALCSSLFYFLVFCDSCYIYTFVNATIQRSPTNIFFADSKLAIIIHMQFLVAVCGIFLIFVAPYVTYRQMFQVDINHLYSHIF